MLLPMPLLQAYANSKGVKIVGDIPIYVGGQSADVWAYQALFELGKGSQPLMVSGVPPDAFSDTGQLWGSPLYDWKVSHLSFQWLPKLLRPCKSWARSELRKGSQPLIASNMQPSANAEGPYL